MLQAQCSDLLATYMPACPLKDALQAFVTLLLYSSPVFQGWDDTWPANAHVRLLQENDILACVSLAATALTYEVLGRKYREPRFITVLAAAAAAICRKFLHARVCTFPNVPQHATQPSPYCMSAN